ncbi:beta-xylosidase [Arthrobacter psychrolactophilus]|uniref:Beta-xylosidase n=1 Tax=Arthrobacter psychrolactophilus TaxID=92442 RepID=A0A2V5IR95_9MICC|nr:family 43 glycosylhydrolase [Arthrobacter psychrolactophilus]PYI39068.1 beta-xylosidase [Arthrobacter psychrolactophilus]
MPSPRIADDLNQAASAQKGLRGETRSPIPGYFADPNLAVVDGRYLLFATSDGSPEWGATAFRAFTSADLVDWQDHGEVFDVRSSAWATGYAWAPGYAQANGKHYLYFTANRGSIGVAVADEALGPYRDSGQPLIAEGDFEGVAIDPSTFVDEDGTAYLFWGNGVAHGVRLAPDMISFAREDVVSYVPEQFREAVWVHRRGRDYYLSWSVDDTRSEDYQLHYSRGSGPLGPWDYQGVLLRKDVARGILATGHHSVSAIPGTDDWVLAYHRFAIPDGNGYHRELRFEQLRHGSDGMLEPIVPSREPWRLPLPVVEAK